MLQINFLKMLYALYFCFIIEPRHEISNNGVCATSKGSDQPAHTQSDQSLCWSLEYPKIVLLLTEQHLEFLSLKGCCTGSSESTLVKMPHCWKSHVLAQYYIQVHFRLLIIKEANTMKLNPQTALKIIA